MLLVVGGAARSCMRQCREPGLLCASGANPMQWMHCPCYQCWYCLTPRHVLLLLPPCPPPAATGYGISAVPLLFTLRHTMIRHTKAQTIQGQSVLALPDKSEELVPGGWVGGGGDGLCELRGAGGSATALV